MMSFSYEPIHNVTVMSEDQTVTIKEMTEIRDQLVEEIMKELSLNRVLVNNLRSFNSSFDVECPSSFTKVTEESSLIQSEEQAEQMDELKTKKISKQKTSQNESQKNDTKNIPKNYGKAILSFIQKSPKTKMLLSTMGVSYSDFMMQVRRSKKKINSIQGLKRMWGYDNLDHKIKKCIRILSYEFMRKHCLEYIFHSKVRNFKVHIKYRTKLIEGIQNPASFNNIKDF